MDSIRGQGGIQMLLTAEQEAQQIVAAARNMKMIRLRQAKEQAIREIAEYRSHVEAKYQQTIHQNGGSSDSTLKRLEMETETKIQDMKDNFSKVSPQVVALLTKYITKV